MYKCTILVRFKQEELSHQLMKMQCILPRVFLTSVVKRYNSHQVYTSDPIIFIAAKLFSDPWCPVFQITRFSHSFLPQWFVSLFKTRLVVNGNSQAGNTQVMIVKSIKVNFFYSLIIVCDEGKFHLNT